MSDQAEPALKSRILAFVGLALLVVCYYYFFCERLPWFWYDDVNVLECADSTTLLQNIKAVFNMLPKTYTIENRPVLLLFSKLATALFGEAPHYQRMFKLLFVLATYGMLLVIAVRHQVKQRYVTALLVLLSTLPPVFIVNAWIYEAETLELFFKVAAFALFLYICENNNHKGLRKILACLALILLVIIADKTKAPAKIIPCLFFSYLVVTKNRDKTLYVMALAALAAVFPYAVFMPQGPAIYHPSGYILSALLKEFASQMWGVMAIGGVSALLAGKDVIRSRIFLFASGWLIWELLFFVAYPSHEMRYLCSSMFAACFWTSVAASTLATSLGSLRKQRILFCVVLGAVSMITLYNSRWVYDFRGSDASMFVLADNHMKIVNSSFRNSLLLYNQPILYYYKRNTTNEFVKIDTFEQEAGAQPDSMAKLPFDNVILIDERGMQLARNHGDNYRWFTTVAAINGSLFDRLQDKFDYKIRKTNLYNNQLGPLTGGTYCSGIFIVTKQ